MMGGLGRAVSAQPDASPGLTMGLFAQLNDLFALEIQPFPRASAPQRVYSSPVLLGQTLFSHSHIPVNSPLPKQTGSQAGTGLPLLMGKDITEQGDTKNTSTKPCCGKSRRFRFALLSPACAASPGTRIEAPDLRRWVQMQNRKETQHIFLKSKNHPHTEFNMPSVFFYKLYFILNQIQSLSQTSTGRRSLRSDLSSGGSDPTRVFTPNFTGVFPQEPGGVGLSHRSPSKAGLTSTPRSLR